MDSLFKENCDTIFALSSAVGRAGVSVIRISGNNSFLAIRMLFNDIKLEHAKATFCSLYCPFSGDLLDESIVILFKSPKSFTGEDVVELHVHGGIAVVNDILETLSKIDGLRIAEPGEFSHRAFINDKMDLTKAEAIVDLIDAETKLQKKIALRQLRGELHGLYEGWRIDIIKILSRLEAFIDFPEDDLPQEELSLIKDRVCTLSTAMRKHLDSRDFSDIVKRGLYIAIIGSPNVGKSSLINMISNRKVAIVSNIPGTTRDVIESTIVLGGLPVRLFDTAGIRNSEDIIEKEGIEMAYHIMENCDIKILILDASNDETIHFASEMLKKHELTSDCIFVINKIDLKQNTKKFYDKLAKHGINRENIFNTSIKEAIGTEEFLDALEKYIKRIYTPSSEPIITRERYRNAITETVRLLDLFDSNIPLEMASETIRAASNSISTITGKIEVDDILDEIFSSFCIGK